jgi:hypothetical protein
MLSVLFVSVLLDSFVKIEGGVGIWRELWFQRWRHNSKPTLVRIFLQGGEGNICHQLSLGHGYHTFPSTCFV